MPREMQIPPGSANPSKTRGNIHPVAENIPVLQHYVADIDSDAKLHATIFFQVIIRTGKFVLDVHCALDCSQRAAERRKNAVAGGPANSSLVS